MKNQSLIILIFLFSHTLAIKTKTATIKKKIKSYLLDPNQDFKKLKAILQAGTIKGVFTTEEITDIFKYLSENYSKLVSSEIIGKSYNKKNILAYHLSNDLKNKDKKTKVLFTGAHHAREILSSVMCVKIFIESLHSLVHKKKNQIFWKYNNLIIIPIINVDSHQLISESYGTENWETHKWKRKNMNPKFCNGNIVSSGVDLNRNYGFHYGETKEDTEECSETFRGDLAFSEPETKAVKNLIDNDPKIVSAMNFHTYGNMWIHPFNYMHKSGKYPINLEKKFIEFYNTFGSEVKEVSKSKYGNAIEMVNYSTDGEASDWMLGEKQIISFSPELGSFNPLAQTFFLPKDLIFEVIQENYKVINLFLNRNVFEMTDLKYGFNNQKNLFINFKNSGLSNIYNSKIRIISKNANFLSNINEITFGNQYDSKNGVVEKIIYDELKNEINFILPNINRLETFNINFGFTNPEIIKQDIIFKLNISLYNNENIQEIELKFDSQIKNYYFLFTIFFVGLIVMITLFFGIKLIFNRKSKKLNNNRNDTNVEIQNNTEQNLEEIST